MGKILSALLRFELMPNKSKILKKKWQIWSYALGNYIIVF